ncbi:MAG: hypothetical protein H0U44_00420 [Flavisolibacter sp.]|jgi:hypothetical protein|nr:hypothetical protein [Flavisolibacter sp.]
MKQFFRLILSSATIFFATQAASQDTLPNFTVRDLGNNRIVVGWVNNYPVVKQISIQRSHDSLKNFKTILSVTDPTAIQNGFADKTALNDHMYYRLFVNLDKGEFFFTASKQPVRDTISTIVNPVVQKIKDTLNGNNRNAINKKPDFVPSFFVYTRKDGYLFINLPDAERKNYRIKFYEEDDSFLFELKTIKEPALSLDKANFMKAGWFKFELYDDEKLVEKNRFYLPREF